MEVEQVGLDGHVRVPTAHRGASADVGDPAVPLALEEGCPERIAGRADHKHFREAGLPAVLLIDGAKADAYPCYHKPCDTTDKVNVTYLRSMIRLVATASALLAVPEPGQAAS